MWYLELLREKEDFHLGKSEWRKKIEVKVLALKQMTSRRIQAGQGGYKGLRKRYACESLQWNHPETMVRNETAEGSLALLKVWEKLCVSFSLSKFKDSGNQSCHYFSIEDDESHETDEADTEDGDTDGEAFEVETKGNVDCYWSCKECGEIFLFIYVRWKNYGPEEDTWEPLEGLGDCRKCLKDFVTRCFNAKILPLSIIDVDVTSGGLPSQGISGFNRFRNKDNPLEDEKNKHLLFFMEIVEYLKPNFVLMENVVDIVKFSEGFLGRYALSQLIHLNYQVRMGMVVAGAYCLPQFRMRVFFWGACPTEKLPQYPLPTQDVVGRGVIPLEFDMKTVAWDEGKQVELGKKNPLLEDAISYLPAVGNYEKQDEMEYGKDPRTEFQLFISLTRGETRMKLLAGDARFLVKGKARKNICSTIIGHFNSIQMTTSEFAKFPRERYTFSSQSNLPNSQESGV
ncbi:DNA (cytosine-5)-methyltransferase CMT3-like [Hibiscus syriacus]|uniref:DNA (cytosine-5)-methyltransferase CMT3-like n=1 Tax=Hibiscus syriacus TaxID=106335 RepID=UPI00192381D6|nr:DNA (cytosine-5)-methyltransferase CMT3-like [Hibiscus syriacus]